MRVVLGGGLGGLSAAHYLLKRFPGEGVTVVERSNRTGGWVQSEQQTNGQIFEVGPRTIRPRGEPGLNTLGLLEQLGLAGKVRPVLSSAPAAKKRLIYADGSLHVLPSSLLGAFRKTAPFSKPLVFYALDELRTPGRNVEGNDESIYTFSERRFGKEIADYLVAPMICGICAGDAKEISVKFLMKTLFDHEQQHGGVLRGLLKNLGRGRKPAAEGALAKRAREERWSIYSLEGGLETLTRALQGDVIGRGGVVKFNSECSAIRFVRGGAVLRINGKEVAAEGVISALPAASLAESLQGDHSALTDLLAHIKAVDVAVLNLYYGDQVLKHDGFGFLVPPLEQLPILGVIFDSCCFPSAGGTLLTVMMGGHWFEAHFGKHPSKEQLLDIALEQLKTILGIEQQPDRKAVHILRQCIPQYTVGHNDRLEKIDSYLRSKNIPMALCGSSYYGVGVNDVILSAKNVVDRL